MLEPLYLTSDALNIVGLSPLAAIPMRLANALAPALTILTNIGYANVVQNPDGTYTRDFSKAGTETPFMSFPDIDYGRVLERRRHPADRWIPEGVLQRPPVAEHAERTCQPAACADRRQRPVGYGHVHATAAGRRPRRIHLADLVICSNNVLGGLLGNVFGALNPLAAQQAQALTASSVPSSSARMVSLGGRRPGRLGRRECLSRNGNEDRPDRRHRRGGRRCRGWPVQGRRRQGRRGEGPDRDAAGGGDTADDAGQTKADDETPPKHAKPDDESQPAAPATGDDATPPKHAKPDDDKQSGADTVTKDKTPKKHGPKLNVVRNGANASSSHDAKPEEKTGGAETGKKDAEPTGAADASASAGPRPVGRVGQRRLRS